MAEERGIPRVIFVNKLDRERASFDRTLEQLKEQLRRRRRAARAPDRRGGRVPRRHRPPHRHRDDLRRDVARGHAKVRCPTRWQTEEHSVHDALDRGDRRRRRRPHGAVPRRRDDRHEGARARARDGHRRSDRLPGAVRAARPELIGVDRLARFIVEEGPAPHVDAGEAPAAAFVFKTLVDPYVGRVNLFKVLQGTVKTDATLLNGRTVTDERLHQVTTMRGKEQEPVSEVPAGDIAAVAKLSDTTTGDVLAVRGTQIDVEPFATPDAACCPPPSGRSRRATRTSSPTRCTGSRTRTRCSASSATPRRTRRCSVGHGRDPPVDRARAPGPQVRRRGRDRGREGPLPRDDHRHRRGRGQAEEADRRARAVRDRVAAGRADRARRRASSSSTRSSAA